jgi:hypothetical protein
MERQRHQKATPGKPAAASSQSWGDSPAASRDWGRRQHRRAAMLLLHGQRVDVHLQQTSQIQPETPTPLFSRAQRAHYRISWAERLARNAREGSTPGVAITLFGVPGGVAAFLGFSTV